MIFLRNGVSYDPANRMTQIEYPQYSAVFNYMTETKSYNVNGQLSSMTWAPGAAGQGAPSGTLAYTYTGAGHTGNNGQVVSVSDGVSGESIVYQYDALKRLSSAASTPQAGSSVAAWTQTFTYDGFGNLTGKTLGGVSSAMAVNGARNQLMNGSGLSNVSYNSNGNLLSVTNSNSGTAMSSPVTGKNGGFAQVPGYCQTSVAACQAAGVTVAGFLQSFKSSPSSGLTAGNPGELEYPCL